MRPQYYSPEQNASPSQGRGSLIISCGTFFLQLGGDGQSEVLVNKNSLQVLVLVASEKPIFLYCKLLAYLVLVMAE